MGTSSEDDTKLPIMLTSPPGMSDGPPPLPGHALGGADGGGGGDGKIVGWDGPDDPENPMNWPSGKKWVTTVSMGLMTFAVTFASSMFSTATLVTAQLFGVSTEVMTLGTSLSVLGFAFGPLIWAPTSEVYRRKWPLFFGFFVFAVFQIAVAVAPNIQTVMLCRFFGGFFGSATIGITGGALVDIWPPVERGVAMCIFSGATFIGPIAGPIVGAFVTESYLGWYWAEYISAIMAFGFGAGALLVVPETSASALLRHRARTRRLAEGDWALHARAEEQAIDMQTLVTRYLSRPVAMLFLEPILLLVTIYMSFVYGIVYLFFEAHPLSFQGARGWSPGIGALPFLAMTVGVIVAELWVIWISRTRYVRIMRTRGRLPPERRLLPMMAGGVLFPVGLFWFAWTSNPAVSWVPQVLSGVPLGMGVILIFLQGLNYITDVYLMHANSAIAANGLLRSFAGAGFPLFATAMYERLGIPWAASLLGFLAVALVPVPVFFFVFGERIRGWSR